MCVQQAFLTEHQVVNWLLVISDAFQTTVIRCWVSSLRSKMKDAGKERCILTHVTLKGSCLS